MTVRLLRTATVSAVAAALVAAAGLSAPAATAQAACDAPVDSTTQDGYTVADPHCEPDGTAFAALPASSVYTGIADGQAYRIEVPDDWNGDLVLYAHGYRGTGQTVYVSSPALREHFVSRGYAWAASSYQTNFYDVEQGVEDTYAMLDRFTEVTGETPEDVIVHGDSMGGHITGVLADRYAGDWQAAYPVCGVLGGTELFDYFLGANVTAAAATGTDIEYAEYAADPSRYQAVVQDEELPELFTQRPALSETGGVWSQAVEQLSGGERPGFDSSFAYWNSFGFAPLQDVPFLFGVYPGLSAGTLGVASGNVADNEDTVYQLDGDPAVTDAEQELNDAVPVRVAADPDATQIPDVAADTDIPVLSLHTLGDLFVPFAMEQSYARKAAENGTDFVSRAVRAPGHCGFNGPELAKGFDDLVLWAETGHQPAGDDVLDPAVVANPTFGCRFTQEQEATAQERQYFVAPACPTFPDIEQSVHREAIEELLAAGVVRGYDWGDFEPDQFVSRAQLASVVAGAGGYEPEDGSPSFPDVEGNGHEDDIRALRDAGLVQGFDDGRYYPTLATSRGQLASVLARALGVDGGSTTDCFDDLADTTHAADICALAALGVVRGLSDGSYGPKVDVTRGQAASLVTRTFG